MNTNVNELDNSYEALFSGGNITEVLKVPESKSVSVNPKTKPNKPKEEPKQPKPSLKEIRRTLELPEEVAKKIKIMAHWELTSQKEIINSALQGVIDEYEKTHGPLVNVPKSQKKK